MYQNGKNISFTDRSNSSVDMFLRDIRKSEPLSSAEEHELWRLMRQGCQRVSVHVASSSMPICAMW